MIKKRRIVYHYTLSGSNFTPGVSQYNNITREYLKWKGESMNDVPNNNATYNHGEWLPVSIDVATATVTISATFMA